MCRSICIRARPCRRVSPLYDGHPWLFGPSWSFAAETALHALRLIGSGLFDELPRLKIILGHLGEGLPFYLWRIDNRNNWMKAAHKYAAQKRVADYFLANFYVTTSGHFSTPALIDTIAEIGADRVMYSVDYPFEDFSDAADWFDRAEISEADRRDRAHQCDEAFQVAGLVPTATSLRMQDEDVPHRAIERGRNAGRCAEIDHAAGEPLHFQQLARADRDAWTSSSPAASHRRRQCAARRNRRAARRHERDRPPTTSRARSSRNARVSGLLRMGPMVWRMAVVAPDMATSTTYFSQIERRISSLISALMPPRLHAWWKSSAASSGGRYILPNHEALQRSGLRDHAGTADGGADIGDAAHD